MTDLRIRPVSDVKTSLSEVQSMYPDVDLASRPGFLAELNRIAARGNLLLVNASAPNIPSDRELEKKCGSIQSSSLSLPWSNAALVELDRSCRSARIHALQSTTSLEGTVHFTRQLIHRYSRDEVLEWIACCPKSDRSAQTLHASGFEYRDDILQLWCPPENLRMQLASDHGVKASGGIAYLDESEFRLRSTDRSDEGIEPLIAEVSALSNDPTSLIRASDSLANERSVNFVLCHEERYIGVMKIDASDDTPGLISYFGILPEYRGRGLASKFFHQASQQAEASLRDGWIVAVGGRNLEALRFFFRQDFQEVGRFELLVHPVEMDERDEPEQD